MHSQKEFKPIYGSFSGREDIEVVTKNIQNMPLKVPFNIGFPSIKRGGTKIKVALPKLQDYGKEQHVSYSQAVMRAMQITSPTAALHAASRKMSQANKIITQTSSTVITNGNRSSTLAKPSITTHVSLGNNSSVDRPSSQVVSSISTSVNIQSCLSSPDKSPTTISSNSHTSNANNSSLTSANSTANLSGNNCSTSKVPMNSLYGSTFQQSKASNFNEATKPYSLNVQPQHKNGVDGKAPVWDGVNSKVVNQFGAVKELKSPHINSVASNQHQHGNKTLQYGPNISVTSLVSQNCLASVTTEHVSSRISSTSNNVSLKDSIKHIEQQESNNKNNTTSSITSTPSNSRRSSESNGTNATNNAVKDPVLKSGVKINKKKGSNESKTSSGLNTPSQPNTPGGSRRSSTSNSSNTIVVPKEPSVNNVLSQQMDAENKNNMSSNSNTSSISNGAVPSSINKSSTNWAHHLFPKDENQKHNTVIAESYKSNVTKLPSPSVKPQKLQRPDVLLTNGKPKVGGLTGLLKDFDPSFQSVKMSPRGLINNGNMCFMNAILQTLSHCPPFYNLLTRIHKDVVHSFNSKTPLVDSLVRFIEEYKQTKRSEGSKEFGEAFSPEYVYDALRGLKRFDSMKGRQEDAEEFLGFLLDGLHEEFLAALKKAEPKNQQSNKASVNNQKEDDWMEVGRKNKTSITRTTDVEETPISRIFGGQFRSVLTCPGSNDSITLQPYQSLQLDIQPDDVKTIGDALKNLTVSECVDDFYSPKNGLVKATKRLYIETLPPILTLHLKRFIYDNVGGTQKLSKHIGYSTTLSIQPDIVAQPHRPSKAVEYRLFGVVYHHGKSATGGHYTADILCQNDWLHIDDTAISPISLEEVASVENPTQPTDRSAYILFYMRN